MRRRSRLSRLPRVIDLRITSAGAPESRECPCRSGIGLRGVLARDLDRYRFLAERDQRTTKVLLVVLRVMLLYPGVYGVVAYRLSHAARTSRLPGPLRTPLAAAGIVLQRFALQFSGVEMSAQAHVGPGLFVNHSRGVVVGAIEAGENLTLSHNVTLGQSTEPGPQGSVCPRIGDRVWLGVGSVVVGGIRLGDDSVVGANAVVLKDVPDRGVAVGVPARIASRTGSFGTVLYRDMADDPARAASLARRDEERVPRSG